MSSGVMALSVNKASAAVNTIKTARKITRIRIIKPPPFDSLGRRFVFYKWECEGDTNSEDIRPD